MTSERKNSRLPPPAFPPGMRRKVHKNSMSPLKPSAGADAGNVAFISPDDPMPPRSDKVAKAFISPDDPMPARSARPSRGFISPEDPIPPRRDKTEPDEEGVVTGMGFDAHMEPEELVAGGDPYVMEVAKAVRKLSEALERKGEAGLRASRGMSRLEATLRAYCVGYLAGRRAEDEDEHSELVRRVQPKAEPLDF
jgi:hypothetical protein